MNKRLVAHFVGEPPVTGAVSARPSSLDQKRREPPDPTVDADVIDDDAALREQLLDVPVGQAVPQVPPHRQDDHFGWEAEPGKLRGCNRRTGTIATHHLIMPGRRARPWPTPTQQCRRSRIIAPASGYLPWPVMAGSPVPDHQNSCHLVGWTA